MNYHIDIRTLALTSGIISLILSICMLYVYIRRKTYDGFTQWTISSVLNFFSMGLLSLRGFLPDFITVVVANTLIVAAISFIADGIVMFAGGKRRVWLFILLSIGVFISFINFTYLHPSVNIRILIISTILVMLYACCGYMIYRTIPVIIYTRNSLLTSVFIVLSLWFMLRIYSTAFFEGPIVDFMKASAFQGASIMVFFGGNIFVTIGLIVLNFQRVELDLKMKTEEVRTLRGILPICSTCKKIRDDEGIWNQIENYIRSHSNAEFSHGICPECMDKLEKELDMEKGKRS